jgi:hypothetical protein
MAMQHMGMSSGIGSACLMSVGHPRALGSFRQYSASVMPLVQDTHDAVYVCVGVCVCAYVHVCVVRACTVRVCQR